MFTASITYAPDPNHALGSVYKGYATGPHYNSRLTLGMTSDTFNSLKSKQTPIERNIKYAIENIDALKKNQTGQSLMDVYILTNHPELIPLYNKLLQYTISVTEDRLPNPDDFKDFKRGNEYHIPMLPELFPRVLVPGTTEVEYDNPRNAKQNQTKHQEAKESIGHDIYTFTCSTCFNIDGQPMVALSIKNMLKGLSTGSTIQPHAIPHGHVNFERVGDFFYVENAFHGALRECQGKLGFHIEPTHIDSIEITGTGIYPRNIVHNVKGTI